jgi:hypothetical protein
MKVKYDFPFSIINNTLKIHVSTTSSSTFSCGKSDEENSINWLQSAIQQNVLFIRKLYR